MVAIQTWRVTYFKSLNTGSRPVLTTKNKIMKKLIKDFHKTMVEACYPIDTFPVYMFMVLALLCPVIVKLLD